MIQKGGSLAEKRPFYFVVVLWGERFRNYFLEYCLPTLLAPGNIPALTRHRSAKYLIATTEADWDLMRASAIFKALERYATPALLELPLCPPDRPYWMQNIIGQKMCCDAVYFDKAYRIFTVPDFIYSDGIVLRLHELASGGAEAVFLNFQQPLVEQERFFKSLRDMGMLPNTSARDTGQPLVFSSRQLVSAALRAIHSATTVNEWTAGYFCGYASTPWWRVPGEDGFVISGMVWNPLLISYAAVSRHDSALLDIHGLDGDYDMATIGDCEKIYAIRDSDEAFVVSHLPIWYHECPIRAQAWGELRKGMTFRASYYEQRYNWLHRTLLFVPSLVHSGPVNEKWKTVEEQALRTLLTWLDPPTELMRLGRKLPFAAEEYAAIEEKLSKIQLPWWRRTRLIWQILCSIWFPVAPYALHPITMLKLKFPRLISSLRWSYLVSWEVTLAICGNAAARRWFGQHFRNFLAIVFGRSMR
jgi:hypothetical protein